MLKNHFSEQLSKITSDGGEIKNKTQILVFYLILI